MNILIVDDNQNKREYIKRQLCNMDENNYVKWVDNYQDAATFIEENSVFIDLIVLDWCFPPNSISRPRYGMGRHLLSYLLYNNIDINVLICTTDKVQIDTEEYPFVKGVIEYYDHIPINIVVNNYLSEDNNVEEDIKTKMLLKRDMKSKTESGYKRRKSSEPWWLK